MIFKNFIGFFLLICFVNSATRLIPPELIKVEDHDETQIVRLAQQQKFTISLSGRTINQKVTFHPSNHNECQFIRPKIQYKTLAQSMAIFDADNEITDILPLNQREVVFVADHFYNIASYSIDKHFPMKLHLPKTSVTGTSENMENMLQPVMVASSNEEYVFYLSERKNFVFDWNSVANSKEFTLEGDPDNVKKAIQFEGYIIVMTEVQGLFIYKINQETRIPYLIQKIGVKNSYSPPVDIELNKNTQMLYVLNYESTIDVYLFDPKNNTKTNKETILHPRDTINLTNITKNHGSQNVPQYEFIGHTNIEISRQRTEQTIMVLFNHNMKTVIAQLNYIQPEKSFIFVRYYKFSLQVKDIQIVKDVMIVVGQQVLGMFPFGIDPRLIDQQFNGFMTLSSLEKVKVISKEFLVGANENTIQYGGLSLNNQAGLNCHIKSNSKLKSINFEANLTTCDDNSQIILKRYCEYSKTFIIEQMDLATSAPVATSIWILLILFTLLIVAGLCCIFVMHKKKERQIRKLQLYFEERRRSEVPASSDRQY